MKALRALLADRRRSQRGSVLSGVLIMVAFLAIIAGALMTELSTNFLLSNALVDRVGTEATVNSAAELALNQLQNTALNSGCPTPSALTLNGQTAAVSVVSCAPVVDQRSLPAFRQIASSAPFTIDASHVNVIGRDEYLVGDSGGNVFAFQYGQSIATWSQSLGGSVTGPPMAMPDVSDANQISNLVPVSNATASPAFGPPCGSACVALLLEDPPGSAPWQLQCYMTTAAPVTTAPAAGGAPFPALTFLGDADGALYAVSATESGLCARQASVSTGYGAIVGGPIVLANGNKDEVFVVANSSPSRFLHYTYSSGRFNLSDNWALPTSGAVGLAVEQSTAPTRLAVTFSSGTVAMLRIDSTFDPSTLAVGSVGSGVTNDPYWCHCPAGNLIGVAGTNGTLYVLDTNLNLYASYPGGSSIRTSPAADGGGDWFFGTTNGQIYEVQKPAGTTAMTLAANYGTAGAIRSSPILAPCPAGICIYFGSADSNLYLVSLDARDAVLTTCISAAPPACSGANPRLWTRVEVGVAGSPQTVHVQGWSYYSP
ncbi:MAG TPA: hypothetical protein VF990_15030 [Candidatus Dormibacteraeota bacterium]